MAQKTGNAEHQILIVDDDDMLRDTLEEVLLAKGYAVATAANGQTALELLREHAFDVVVTDLNMPGMTGIELLERISTSNICVTPVLMSSLFSGDAKERAVSNGAFANIDKPIVTSRLIDVIETGIRYRHRRGNVSAQAMKN